MRAGDEVGPAGTGSQRVELSGCHLESVGEHVSERLFPVPLGQRRFGRLDGPGWVGETEAGFVQDEALDARGDRCAAHGGVGSVGVAPERDRLAGPDSHRVDHRGDILEIPCTGPRRRWHRSLADPWQRWRSVSEAPRAAPSRPCGPRKSRAPGRSEARGPRPIRQLTCRRVNAPRNRRIHDARCLSSACRRDRGAEDLLRGLDRASVTRPVVVVRKRAPRSTRRGYAARPCRRGR